MDQILQSSILQGCARLRIFRGSANYEHFLQSMILYTIEYIYMYFLLCILFSYLCFFTIWFFTYLFFFYFILFYYANGLVKIDNLLFSIFANALFIQNKFWNCCMVSFNLWTLKCTFSMFLSWKFILFIILFCVR